MAGTAYAFKEGCHRHPTRCAAATPITTTHSCFAAPVRSGVAARSWATPSAARTPRCSSPTSSTTDPELHHGRIITRHRHRIASTAIGDVVTNPNRPGDMDRRQGPYGADGKSRFYPSMLVEAEASLIINEAMDRGEPVRALAERQNVRAYPYGVRTARRRGTATSSDPTCEPGIQVFGHRHLAAARHRIGVLGILSAVGYFSVHRRSQPGVRAKRSRAGYSPPGGALSKASWPYRRLTLEHFIQVGRRNIRVQWRLCFCTTPVQ